MKIEQIKTLIVEDESLIAIELKNVLENIGVSSVDICSKGEEAIELCKTNEYDFVFVDIVLAGKMDGIEAAEQIKKISDAGIIFLTSYGFKDTVQKAKYIEPYSFIVKPYQKRDIYNALEIAIQKRNTDLKIRNQKRLLNSILSNINAGIIAIDRKEKVIFINKYAANFWNLKDFNFEDLELSSFYKTADAIEYFSDEEITLENFTRKFWGANLKAAFLGDEKRIISEKNFFFFDEEEQRNIKIIYFEDITELFTKEKELNKAKQFYLSVLEKLPVIIFLTNERGELEYLNPYAKHYFNYNSQNIKSFLYQSIHPEDYDLFSESFKRAFNNKEENIGEIRVFNRDKELRYLYVNAVPLYDYNSYFIGYLGVCVDITEIKRAEEEIIKAKEKAEKAELTQRAIISNFSHEMRTPLTGVFGIADILLEKEKDPEKVEMLKILKDSANKLHESLNNIIDLAKETSNESELLIEEFKLVDIIRKCSSFYNQHISSKPIKLELDISNELEQTLFGNSYGYSKVLNLLLDNAVKFTKQGFIKIKAEIEEEVNNIIFVKTILQDSGSGIKKEDVEKIFDPFFQSENYRTRKHGGLGIGLSIAKRIVEKNGGYITAESEFGKGTTIAFTMKFSRFLDKINCNK